MGIKVGEIGKLFRYNTGFDLSSFSSLTLNFIKPNGTDTLVKTDLSANPVSAPASAYTDEDGATVAANTYMQFSTVAADFDVAGTWRVCGIYVDGTPKEFHGDQDTFEVDPAC